MPVMIFTVVDLPAPFGPEKSHNLAGSDLETHILNRRNRSIAAKQMLNLEQRSTSRIPYVAFSIIP